MDSVPTEGEQQRSDATAQRSVLDIFDLDDPDVQQLASALIRLLRSLPKPEAES